MVIELSQDVIDRIRSFLVPVHLIERVPCGFCGQCWDIDNLAVRRDDGDSGGNAQADVAEPTQFIHDIINLSRTRALRIEDGFGVVQDYDHLLRG